MVIRISTPISTSTDPSKVYTTMNPPDPDVSPQTYILPAKSEDIDINPDLNTEKGVSLWLSILVISSIIIFTLPFILVKYMHGDWTTSSPSDWLMVLLTGGLGLSALLSYRQNESQKTREVDLNHFNNFMNLADSALSTLYSIEPLSFSHKDPEKTILKWNICSQKLSSATREIEAIRTIDIRKKARHELHEFQSLFRSFLSKKPMSFFVHLDKCMPSIIAFSSNLWNVEKNDYVLFMMEHIYGHCLFSDDLMEEFIADFDRVSELGYLPGITKKELLLAYEESKEWLHREHDFMPEEERIHKPIISPCPSKYALNTIAEFCTDLPRTEYTKEQLSTFMRGSWRNYHWTNFEALFVQINEFVRTKQGGVKSKRFPEIEIEWKKRSSTTRLRETRPVSSGIDSLFNVSKIIWKANRIQKESTKKNN